VVMLLWLMSAYSTFTYFPEYFESTIMFIGHYLPFFRQLLFLIPDHGASAASTAAS